MWMEFLPKLTQNRGNCTYPSHKRFQRTSVMSLAHLSLLQQLDRGVVTTRFGVRRVVVSGKDSPDGAAEERRAATVHSPACPKERYSRNTHSVTIFIAPKLSQNVLVHRHACSLDLGSDSDEMGRLRSRRDWKKIFECSPLQAGETYGKTDERVMRQFV